MTLKSIHLALVGLCLGLLGCEGGQELPSSGRLEVDLSGLRFGGTLVGDLKLETLDLRNTGAAELRLSKITTSGSGFTVDISDGIIPPGGSLQLKVSYAPLTEGDHQETLELQTSDALGAVRIPLTGEAELLSLDIDPSPVSFSQVTIGSTATQLVSITNNNSFELNLQVMPGVGVKECTAPGTEAFCYEERASVLAPDGQRGFSVSFSPQLTGARDRGTIIFSACASGACEQDLVLDGIGVHSGLRCEPFDLDFGNVPPNRCVDRSITCQNDANTTISVEGWALGTASGWPQTGAFIAEPSDTLTVAPGDDFEIDVSFCPVRAGEDRAELRLQQSTTEPELSTIIFPIRATGGGPQIEVLPRACDFGVTSLLAPLRCTVLISNAGNVDLEVRNVSIDTEVAFAVVEGGPGLVEPGETVSITIEFLPLMPGSVSANLQIDSNDPIIPLMRVPLEGRGESLGPCDFSLAFPSLDFGAVEVGRVAQRSLVIYNNGTDDCLVSGLRLQAPNAYSIAGPTSARVRPGGSFAAPVHYSPVGLEAAGGTLEFWISNPNTPLNQLNLTGESVRAAPALGANVVDFGALSPGCQAISKTLSLHNTTEAPINLVSIEILGSPAFTLQNIPDFPSIIPPLASVDFELSMSASSASRFVGLVNLDYTTVVQGGVQNRIAGLELLGEGAAEQVDRFTQTQHSKVDVLMVIDDSCSLGQEQASIASNFLAFTSLIESLSIDYQISVITTDATSPMRSGRFVGPTAERQITPRSSPSPSNLFSQYTQVGTSGAGFEQGLLATKQALSGELLLGHNIGFLRPDAALSIVYMSDEQDGAQEPLPLHLANLFSIRWGSALTVSAIVGDTPGGCSGFGGNAGAGPRYISLQQATGGVFQSVCTPDWASSMTSVGESTFGLRRNFQLTAAPQTPPEVLVDGVSLSAQNFSVDGRWLRFSPVATPAPNAQLEVRYPAQCL